MQWKAAIITTCDDGSRTELDDTSAQVIRELVEEELYGEIVEHRVVPNKKDEIMAALIEITEYYQPDLILTTGGIEFRARDVTPEATLNVMDRYVPGITETMRAATIQRNPRVMLSRAVAVIRGRTLIINLPGTPKGVHDNLSVILETVPFAMRQLRGLEDDERF